MFDVFIYFSIYFRYPENRLLNEIIFPSMSISSKSHNYKKMCFRLCILRSFENANCRYVVKSRLRKEDISWGAECLNTVLVVSQKLTSNQFLSKNLKKTLLWLTIQNLIYLKNYNFLVHYNKAPWRIIYFWKI